MKKAVFFDRDGVVNDDKDYYYVTSLEMFHLNRSIIPLLKHLKENNYLAFIVTNQAGINKGLYTMEDVDAIHGKMVSELSEYGLFFDEIYYCSHHPEWGKCVCRKPGTLFIEKALARFDIDPALSYFIGDRDTDIEAGQNAGLKTIKVERNANLEYLINLIS